MDVEGAEVFRDCWSTEIATCFCQLLALGLDDGVIVQRALKLVSVALLAFGFVLPTFSFAF